MSQQGLPVKANIENQSRVLVEKLSSLRKMPEELMGKIPESVWASLTPTQREEILRQYGIFEKYTQISEASQISSVESQNYSPQTTEIPIDQLENISKSSVQAPVVNNASQQNDDQKAMKADFAKAVDQKNQLEQQSETVEISQQEITPKLEREAPPKREVVQSIENKEQIVEKIETRQNIKETEKTPVQVNTPQSETRPQQKVVPKFSGYPVSEHTARKSEDLSKNGDPRNGGTWTATLLEKLWALLGA